MSGGRRGMRTNVAEAMGFTDPIRDTVQSVACRVCRARMEFESDALGRLIERCPRGCKPGKLMAPDPEVLRSIAEELHRPPRTKRRGSTPRGTSKNPLAKLDRSPKTCAAKKCKRPFTPRHPKQKYCSRPCASSSIRGAFGQFGTHSTL